MEFGKLFKNWYLLRVQTPPVQTKEQFLKFELKTKAHCTLVAPSRLYIPAEKPQ